MKFSFLMNLMISEINLSFKIIYFFNSIKMIENTNAKNQIVSFDVNTYVENRIQKLMKEHDEVVKEQYYLHKELTDEEYNKLINDLEIRMHNVPEEYLKPTNPYTTEKQIQEQWQLMCIKEKGLIERDMKRMHEFKVFIESERKKLMAVPTNSIKLTSNLRDYISKQIHYYYKDIYVTYYDMFHDKIMHLCPESKDYSKTIKSVYDMKQSKKATKILNEFFDKLKSFLYNLVSKFNDIDTNTQTYMMIEKFMKEKMNSFLMAFDILIGDFIEKQLNYIDDEQMDNSKVAKQYCEHVMAEMNKSLMSDLPEVLNQELNIRCEDFYDSFVWYFSNKIDLNSLRINKEETPEPKVAQRAAREAVKALTAPVIEVKSEKSFIQFLDSLPDEFIECNELVSKYNEYFGTSYSNVGFGKLKLIKDSFEKKPNVKRNGKVLTLYKKK